MTPSVTISLAGLPRGKGRPRFSRRSGRAYTDAQTESYEGALRMAAAQAMAGEPPLEGPLGVIMTAIFPIPASWTMLKRSRAKMGQVRPTGRPDCDNLLKTIDSCNGIVWKDDAQIVSALVQKEYGITPGVIIVVNALETQ